MCLLAISHRLAALKSSSWRGSVRSLRAGAESRLGWPAAQSRSWVEPRLLRRGLLDNGYAELPITSQYAVNIDSLPPLHKDPFDRLLLAHALTEGITLLTDDAQLAHYPGPVRKV